MIEKELRTVEIQSESQLQVLEVQLKGCKERAMKAEAEVNSLRKSLSKEQTRNNELTARIHALDLDRNTLAHKWEQLNQTLQHNL